MAVLGRLLISSAERLDLPDLLSMDSYAGGDWKYFLRGMVGTDKPYILKGFDIIDPQNAIGTQNCSVRVANSMVFFPESSSGPFFHGLEEGHDLSEPLVPELRKNAVNYVYLTFSTFNTSVDTRAFWDPDKDGGIGGEFTQDVNTESVLKVDINVSTGSFPQDTIPVAKVTVGPVMITAIEDARDSMFRLGSGGISPDPFNRYDFKPLPAPQYARLEPANIITSSSEPNPFQGGDKNITSLKEWMDVVMTKLLEIGGTNYWYEDVSTFNLVNLFADTLASTIQSKGSWVHSSATQGLLTWSEDLQIKNVIDKRDILIRSGSKQLQNEQVMYVKLLRDKPINSGDVAVTWLNNANYVNGITGSFENLTQGDWIKKHDDKNVMYLRVEGFYANTNISGGTTTAALARSIKLSAPYQGTSSANKAVYAKGSYINSEVQVAYRADFALEQAGADLYWLAMRSDIIEQIGDISSFIVSGDITEANGTTAKFTSASPHNLIDGDRVTITDAPAYNGTVVVEVEDANNFVFATTGTGDVSGANAGFAIVTTVARSTVDGYQLESANHGFESGNTINIADTTNYNGAYKVNVRSATEVSIPFATAESSESAGTATLARIDVRSESGIERVIQGESKDISGSLGEIMMQYIGMPSDTQYTPIYSLPPSYNTLLNYANYNSGDNDNLTLRAARLTSMMADRVQERDMELIGRTTIRNTTNGSNQDITASASILLEKPGSPAQVVTLDCSIPVNSAAVMYFTRNNSTAISLQIKPLGTPYLLEENCAVLFYRLNDTNVYTWDGVRILANSTYTTAAPDDAQNKNILINSPGQIDFNALSGLVTFTNSSADISIIIPGSSAANVVDVSAINTLGTLVLADGQMAWVRVDRVNSKTFNTVQTSDGPEILPNGAIYITDTADVPVDQDVIVLFTRAGDNLLQSKVAVPPSANIYDEPLRVISGIPVDDNEIAGPVFSGQSLVLPTDSRDGDSAQDYVVGSGMLKLFLNGQLLEEGEDWSPVGSPAAISNSITILQQLEIGDTLKFRIDSQGGVFIANTGGGGGGSDSLQTAYNTGRFIAVASAQPVTITGPAGQKLLVVNGDVKITGVLDPSAVSFSQQVSTPMSSTEYGLWIDDNGDLIQQRGASLSSVNLTQSATGNMASVALSAELLNSSGVTITKMTPVRITGSGDVDLVDVSIESQAIAIAGLAAEDISDGNVGEILASGKLTNITSTASFGEILYVAKTGGVTSTKPSIGVEGFVAGDFVIKLGVIAKNKDNSSNKDLLINITVVGQL